MSTEFYRYTHPSTNKTEAVYRSPNQRIIQIHLYSNNHKSIHYESHIQARTTDVLFVVAIFLILFCSIEQVAFFEFCQCCFCHFCFLFLSFVDDPLAQMAEHNDTI